MDASKITDDAGNELTGGLPAGAETFTLDNTAPTPALGATPQTHDGTSTSVVTVDFGEAVNGFTVDGLRRDRRREEQLHRRRRRLQLHRDGDAKRRRRRHGPSVAPNAATDRAGNASAAAQPLTVTYVPPPALTVEDAEAEEGEDLSFTVTLVNGAVPAAFTVTIGYEDGSATAGTDYTATEHVLDFAGTANESHTFSVPTTEDTLVEDAETFTVTLTASDAFLDATDTATATLTDDDEAAYAVTVEPAAIAEAGGESTVTVSTGGVTFPAAQTFTLALGGTAALDTDYTIGSQTLDARGGRKAR